MELLTTTIFNADEVEQLKDLSEKLGQAERFLDEVITDVGEYKSDITFTIDEDNECCGMEIGCDERSLKDAHYLEIHTMLDIDELKELLKRGAVALKELEKIKV